MNQGKKGIDVSKHQGNIGWKKVKADGIEFAIIRIGYGKYLNQKDVCFEQNYEGAKANGIPVGIYHYSYALNTDDARLEAGCVLSWLKERKLDLPIYFDIEDKSQSKLSKQALTEICKAFCNRIEAAGYWAGIYANKNWSINLIDGPSLGKRYTYWIAQYYKECTYNGPYDMWQYSSTGRVSGINNNVDMNYMYRDLISEINGNKSTNSNNTKTSSPCKEDNKTNTSSYSGSSLVDYLKSKGIDSSFSNRTKLAQQNGINDYRGTAEQNISLLNKLRGIKVTTTNKYYPTYSGNSNSLVDSLKSLKIDSSFSNRKKIANANGINNYIGTASQNTNLLKLLKNGQLKK